MEKILEKINKAGITLLETISPEDTYSVVVNEAIKLVDAEFGSVLLEIDNKLTRVYASDSFFLKLKVKKGGTIEQSFLNNKLIVNNIVDSTKVDKVIAEKGIKSVILIPLVYRSKPIGVLSVLSLNKEHFTKKQIDMLRVYGAMASFAIKKAQLYGETNKALAIRDMFISMAAHELRTPLTSISGYIQLLYSKLADKDDITGKWIKELYEENKRMMHLVKEILEVNRLRAGQLQFRWQECDLHVLIKRAVNHINKNYPGRSLYYKNYLKEEAKIIGDSERLEQVIINVIDNGMKYSHDTTSVEISLKKKANFYIVSIKDYGKGIDEKDLKNIFDGQHKGDGGEEGFGLGLFFVENIVRQHRGAINIKSKLKQGTTMEIRIPQAKFQGVK